MAHSRTARRWILAGLILFEAVVLAAIAIAASSAWLGGIVWRTGWWSTGPVTRTFSEQVLLGDERARVRAVNALGRLEVTGSPDARSIEVRAAVRWLGWLPPWTDDPMDLTDIDVRKEGGTVTVTAAQPGDGWPLAGLLGHASVDLALTVPAESDLDLNAQLGTVTVRGVTGELRLHANMGEVRASDVGGDLTIRANMGDIVVRDAVLSDRMSVRADMGSIDFTGRPARDAEVISHMGSIRLALPPGQSYRLDARASMGSIDIGLPFDGSREGDSVRGTIGHGPPAGSIKIESDMGSIDIEEAS
ncbi:MAG TPA: DUF4097 family beta strand repeat-containing protein [Limnochordia bacterium]